MKKLLCLILALVMVMSVCVGCNDNKTTDPTTSTPTGGTDATKPTGGTDAPKLSSTLSLETDVSKYITLGQYIGVEYGETKWSVTDEDVNKNLSTAFPEYPKIKEGKLKDGDNVNINFLGYVDGEEDPNCSYEDKGGYDLTLGSGVLIDGFESGLVGKEIGTTVELRLTFPKENYHEDYLGKEVVFKVTINYVTGSAVYPELTDERVNEKTNGEYKTVEAYRKYVRENLEANAKAQAESKNLAALMEAILKNATFAELPQEEIDFYNAYVLAQNQSYATMFGMTLEDWLTQMLGTSLEKFEEYNKEAAEDYVKNKLVLIAIAQAESKNLTDEEFDKRLKDDMKAYGFDSLADFKKAIEENDSLLNWRTSYVLNDLEDWLLEQGVPVEKQEDDKDKTESDKTEGDKTEGETEGDKTEGGNTEDTTEGDNTEEKPEDNTNGETEGGNTEG